MIGGGIAGISVAARLSKHAKIGLFEQEDFIAHHSSSRSAAVFISDYGNSDVCELNLITFHELQSKYPNILKQRGLMSLEKSSDIEEFDKHAKSLGLSLISVNEAKEKAPIIYINSVKQAVSSFSKQNEGIQIVVNCAGIGPAAKTVSRGEAHPNELFAKVININLIGSFNVASVCAAEMVKNREYSEDGFRGIIVNTASVLSLIHI